MTVFKKALRTAILAALGVLDSLFINRIKSLVVQNALRLQLAPVRAIAVALTDENPRNDEQVEAILQDHLNQAVPPFAESEINRLLEKIQNESTRALLQVLSIPGVEMIRLVSDADPNNQAQIESYANEYINREDVQDALLYNWGIPTIEKRVKDPYLRELLIAVLQGVDESNDEAI